MSQFQSIADIPSRSLADKSYKIKMSPEGNLSCNCASWIFNTRKATVDVPRSCKHTDYINNLPAADKLAMFSGKYDIHIGNFNNDITITKKEGT